jgi:excisionase family DNA binding protein
LILPKQKPAGEKEMTTQSTPPPGTWNARNLLTVPEVVEWAGVHPKTVYRWIKEGKHEAIQFGPRTFRVPEASFDSWLHDTSFVRRNKPAFLPALVGKKVVDVYL